MSRTLKLFKVTLVFGLLLAACSEPEPRRPIQLLGQATLSGPEAETVVVTLYEIPPGTQVESITLVGPDGTRLPGTEFRRGSRESGPGYVVQHGVGITIRGGSASGIIPGGGYGPYVTGGGESVASQVITTEIAVPDPQAYLAEADLWHVEIDYLDITGSPRQRRIPAPRGAS